MCTFYLAVKKFFVFTTIRGQDFQFGKEPESNERNYPAKETL